MPYRTAAPGPDADRNTLRAGPILHGDAGRGFYGPARHVCRTLLVDGRAWHRDLSIWNGQRDGLPTISLPLDTVLTREMWNAYKQAVDELFDAFEQPPE